MKKYFIIALIMLIIPSIMYSTTEQEIVKKIQEMSMEIKQMISRSVMQDSIMNQWNTVFEMAKSFVIDNSKKDSDCMSTLENIKKAHNDIMNIIKVTLADSLSVNDLNDRKSVLMNIQKNLDNITTKFSRIKFSSYNKVQAQNILLFMGKTIKDIIQEASKNIDAKIYTIEHAVKRTKPLPTPVKTPQPKPLPKTPGFVTQEEPEFIERANLDF